MGVGRSLAEHWNSFAAGIDEDVRTIGRDENRNRRALAAGIATALAVYAALLLNLEYPMWSGMTAFTVTCNTLHATFLKGVMRVIGTIIAALFAVFLLGFIAGNNWALTATLFATVSYGLYRSFTSVYPYAWLLGAITIGLILMDSMASPDSGLHVAAYRAAEIVTGVLVAFAVDVFLLPPASDPEHDRALAVAPKFDQALAIRTALEAGTGICIVVGLYALFDFPGFTGAAVSLTRIVDPNPELGHHRGFLRLLGCGLGGAAGLLMVGASIAWLPAYLFAIFVFCCIFGYFFAGPPVSAYAGMQAGFAFIIAYAPSTTPTDTLDPAIDRFAGILLAFLVFWIIDALFAPETTQTTGSPPPAPADVPPDKTPEQSGDQSPPNP